MSGDWEGSITLAWRVKAREKINEKKGLIEKGNLAEEP